MLIKEGEFKKAREALTNTPKWNGNVEEKLKPLFPERVEELKEESFKHQLKLTSGCGSRRSRMQKGQRLQQHLENAWIIIFNVM